MAGPVSLATMTDVLYAAHLAAYVESPFEDRGGLMLVGPPASLKSAMLAVLDRHYHNALMLSDVNMPTLVNQRPAMAQGTIRTLVLPELQKVYERDPRTAVNVEGTLRALVAEGFASASYEDPRPNRTLARCMVVGGMTQETQALNFKRWEDTGFNRRFLWPLIQLDNPEVLEEAVLEWLALDFDGKSFPPLPASRIPNTTTRAERDTLRNLVKYQPGGSHATQLSLLVKMLAVLKWWNKERGARIPQAMETVREFARTLQRTGARLTVPMPWVDANGVYLGGQAGALTRPGVHGKNGTRPKRRPVKKHRCPRCNRLHPGTCRRAAGKLPRSRKDRK